MKQFVLNKNGKTFGKISINIDAFKKIAVIGGLVFSLNALTGCGDKDIELTQVDPSIESMLSELENNEDLSIAMPEHVDYVNYVVKNGDTIEGITKKYLTDNMDELKSRESDILEDNEAVRKYGLIDGQNIKLRNVKESELEDLGYTKDVSLFTNFHFVSQEVEFLSNIENVLQAQMLETKNDEYLTDLFYLVQEIDGYIREYESENKIATDELRNKGLNINAEIYRITNYDFNDFVKPVPLSVSMLSSYDQGAHIK